MDGARICFITQNDSYTANVLTIKTMDFDHVPSPHKCLWTFHHSFNESWLHSFYGQNICSVDVMIEVTILEKLFLVVTKIHLLNFYNCKNAWLDFHTLKETVQDESPFNIDFYWSDLCRVYRYVTLTNSLFYVRKNFKTL